MGKLTNLSRKNLLNLLIKGQGRDGAAGYVPASEFLAEWTRDFYARLIIHNPGYEVFSRGIEDRRFDALSRLIVGDETCASVGFDGANVLIATNQADHARQVIHYRIEYFTIWGMDITDGVVIQPILRLFYNEEHIGDFVDGVAHYHYNPDDNNCFSTGQNSLHFHIDAAEHGIPLLPEITVDLDLEPIIPVPYPMIPGGYVVGGIGKDVSIEPLARRVDKLFYFPLRLLAAGYLQGRDDLVDRYYSSPETITWRESFLHDSLAWETATWFKKAGINPRDFSDPDIPDIKRLITALDEDYVRFKEENGIVAPSTAAVKLWAQTVVAKISSGELEAPSFIAARPELFMERALRYFEDLDKFFDFIKIDAMESGDFSRVLAAEVYGRPRSSEIPVIIPNELPEDTHAELRVLWKAIQEGRPVKYIAVSKLCCPLCNLILKTYGVEHIVNSEGENHAGGHGKIYPWVLPDAFYNNSDFMIQFLGEELYALLLSMDDKSLRLNSVDYSIRELVKLILEGLGSLQEEDLEVLGVRKKVEELTGSSYRGDLKLFYNEADLPYESDDDEAPEVHPGSASTHKKFIKHPIMGDGNCLFEAVLEGASLAGINGIPENQMALRERVQNHMRDPEHMECFHNAIAQAIVDMVIAGDLRGVSDSDFRGILQDLLEGKHEMQSAQTSRDVVRENILQAVLAMNLTESYIELIGQDGFWSGEPELGAATEILGIRFLIHRGNRIVPINNNAENDIPVVHLRLNGGHYDLLTENPDYVDNHHHVVETEEEEEGDPVSEVDGTTTVDVVRLLATANIVAGDTNYDTAPLALVHNITTALAEGAEAREAGGEDATDEEEEGKAATGDGGAIQPSSSPMPTTLPSSIPGQGINTSASNVEHIIGFSLASDILGMIGSVSE